MPDIFLYAGEARSTDVRLRDPSTLAISGTVTLTEAGQAMAAVASLVFSSTTSLTESGEGVSGTGSLGFSGAVALAESGLRVSSAGTLSFTSTGQLSGGFVAMSGISVLTEVEGTPVTPVQVIGGGGVMYSLPRDYFKLANRQVPVVPVNGNCVLVCGPAAVRGEGELTFSATVAQELSKAEVRLSGWLGFEGLSLLSVAESVAGLGEERFEGAGGNAAGLGPARFGAVGEVSMDDREEEMILAALL